MDQHRFDRLTRAVAHHSSRRSFLGGLAVTLMLGLFGRTARAAPGEYLAPGQECTDSSQCGDTRYNSMSCDDNGTTSDGTLHCCAYEYGYCWDDDGCCSGLICSYGSCSPPGLYGLPLGAQCFSDDQCLDDGNGIVCGNAGVMTLVCCVSGGNGCTEDSDCCMPNNCLNGFCQ